MFCYKCGGKLTEDAKFCYMCGAKLEIADSAENKNASDPVFNVADLLSEDKPTEKKRGSEPETKPLADDKKAETAEKPRKEIVLPTEKNTVPDYQHEYRASKSDIAAAKKNPVVTVLLSILFGIFILAILLFVGAGESIRATLDKNMISEAVSESDMSEIIVGDILNDKQYEDVIEDFGGNFEDLGKKGTIAEALGTNSIFDEESAEKALKDSFLSDYIIEVIEGYEEYILFATPNELLSTEKLYELASENTDELSELCGERIMIYDEILLDYLDSIPLEDANPQEALDGAGEVTSLFLSPVVLIALLVIAVLIAVINGAATGSVTAPMFTVSICSLLTGGTLMVVSASKNAIFKAAGLDYKAVTGYLSDILDASLCVNLEKYGIVFVIAGAAILVGAIISLIIGRTRAKKLS